MFRKTRGENVRIEFSSSDASTAGVAKLYDAKGNERVLGANERLVVKTLRGFSASTISRVVAFFDEDRGSTEGTGERVLVYSQAGVFDGSEEGSAGGPGTLLMVKAAASGLVDVNGQGEIETAGTPVTRPTWKQDLNGVPAWQTKRVP